jgi:hypothetical protein
MVLDWKLNDRPASTHNLVTVLLLEALAGKPETVAPRRIESSDPVTVPRYVQALQDSLVPRSAGCWAG